MSLSVDFLTRVLQKSSTRTLQNTVKNSQDRIAKLNAAGLSNSGAAQTEINRIQAAVDILTTRGDPIERNTAPASIPHNLTGSTGLIHQPWFKPAALVLVGFYLFRKFQ